MKRALLIGMLLGATLLSVLLASNGLNSTLSVALAAGPALLLLIPLHFLPLLLDVFGWQNLLPGTIPIRRLLLIAVMRESIDRLLPVANIGGELVGIRLLVKTSSVDAPTAIASVVAETLLILIAQCLFIVVGAICLLEVAQDVDLVTVSLVILGASLLVGIAICVLCGYGLIFSRLARAGERLFPGRAIMTSLLARSHRIYVAIERLRSSPARLSQTLAWQFAGLLAGTAETWLALRWFGTPVNLPEAIALESLTQAVRQFVFLIPAGLGVQELGLVGLGHFMALDGQTAMALSAVKRMRELAIGVPALVALYLLEGRHMVFREKTRGPP